MKRRISHGQAMRSIFGRVRVTHTVGPWLSVPARGPAGPANPCLPRAWNPPSRVFAARACVAQPRRGALAKFLPRWQTTTTGRPAYSAAQDETVR